jgi:hypothetical protein
MTIMVASNVFRLRGGVGVAKGARIAEDQTPHAENYGIVAGLKLEAECRTA